METRFREIKAHSDSSIIMRVTPGHFATRNSHINYYVEVTRIKSLHKTARLAGRLLAEPYAQTTPIDTIVCLEGVEAVAAFTALTLSESTSRSMNAGQNIAVVTPELNATGQLIFRDNVQPMIWNQGVLLMVASATTGITINQAIECIEYYNGRISGISAIFSVVQRSEGHKINSIFTLEDLPDYRTYSPADCPRCQARQKIDALVNSYGYSRL